MFSKEFGWILKIALKLTSADGRGCIQFDPIKLQAYTTYKAKVKLTLQFGGVLTYTFFLLTQCVRSKVTLTLQSEFPLCYTVFLLHILVIIGYLLLLGIGSGLFVQDYMTQGYRHALKFQSMFFAKLLYGLLM